MSQAPTLAALTAARTAAPAAPVAPAAPAAPIARSFWVSLPEGSVQKTEAETVALATANPALPICVVGSTTWTTATALGLIAAPATAPAPAPAAVAPAPAPASAPVAPAPAPAATAPAPLTTYAAPAPLASPASLPAALAGGTSASAIALRNMLAARGVTPTLSSIIETVESEGGGNHTHPFANLKEGNWATTENVEKAPGGATLPNGARAWTGIFLDYRVGATGWKGQANAGKGGSAPAWKFVVTCDPNEPQTVVDRATAVDRIVRFSRNVQMTPADKKVVFDDVGRMTPEVQILCWATDGTWAGLVILVVGGYNGFSSQIKELDKAEGLKFDAVTFAVLEQKEENKKAIKEYDELVKSGSATPDALAKAKARCNWVSNYVGLSKSVDPRGLALKQGFEAVLNADAQGTALLDGIVGFLKGEDFTGGLTQEQLVKLLGDYSALPEPKRGR